MPTPGNANRKRKFSTPRKHQSASENSNDDISGSDLTRTDTPYIDTSDLVSTDVPGVTHSHLSPLTIYLSPNGQPTITVKVGDEESDLKTENTITDALDLDIASRSPPAKHQRKSGNTEHSRPRSKSKSFAGGVSRQKKLTKPASRGGVDLTSSDKSLDEEDKRELKKKRNYVEAFKAYQAAIEMSREKPAKTLRKSSERSDRRQIIIENPPPEPLPVSKTPNSQSVSQCKTRHRTRQISRQADANPPCSRKGSKQNRKPTERGVNSSQNFKTNANQTEEIHFCRLEKAKGSLKRRAIHTRSLGRNRRPQDKHGDEMSSSDSYESARATPSADESTNECLKNEPFNFTTSNRHKCCASKFSKSAMRQKSDISDRIRRRKGKEKRSDKIDLRQDSDTDSFKYPGRSKSCSATTNKIRQRSEPNRFRITVFEDRDIRKRRKKIGTAWNDDEYSKPNVQENKTCNKDCSSTLITRSKRRDSSTQFTTARNSPGISTDKNCQIGSPLPVYKNKARDSSRGGSYMVSKSTSTMTNQPCHCYRSFTKTKSNNIVKKSPKKKPARSAPVNKKPGHNLKQGTGDNSHVYPNIQNIFSTLGFDKHDGLDSVIHIQMKSSHRTSRLVETQDSLSLCSDRDDTSNQQTNMEDQVLDNYVLANGDDVTKVDCQKEKSNNSDKQNEHKKAQNGGDQCTDSMMFKCSNGNSNVTAMLHRADVCLNRGKNCLMSTATSLYDYYRRATTYPQTK